jgi:galactose mutarotase-like enzyme
MITMALLAAASLAGAQYLDDTRRTSLITLRSPKGSLTAVIDPAHGANLVGLELDGRELLYRGLNFCPVTGWDGKAPILWPATGRNYAADPAGGVAAFGWILAGQRMPMPIHGFARDRAWNVVARHRNSLTVELNDDAQSRALYPFGFRLRLIYTLSENGLTLDHQVFAAKGQRNMPFSIGNHVTFVTHAGASISTVPTRRITLDSAGRPTGIVPQARLDREPVNGFARLETVSLAGYPRVARAAFDLGNGVRIAFTQSASGASPRADPIRYNLWGDPDAGYFAVEPWYGLQNALADGRGVVLLPAGQRFDWHMTMRISRSPAHTRK